MRVPGERVIQAERTAYTKILRWEYAWPMREQQEGGHCKQSRMRMKVMERRSETVEDKWKMGL